jgi:Ser/Thr protein kinase RdoA (MazF antagonist)
VDVSTFLAMGVPDRRSPGPWLASVARSFGDPSDESLRHLADGLAARLARVAACGLPDTLVHGDLHGGNVIGAPKGARVILDWGDCVIGHPAFDILTLTDSLSPDEAADVQARWASWWRRQVPGSDPETALDLLRPLHELRFAAVMADFLASIEATEQPYHRDDVRDGLARAIAFTR